MGSLKLSHAVRYAILFGISLGIVAVAGYFLLPERYAPLPFISSVLQSNFLFWSWANFDGEHYLSIAKYGYQIRNGFTQYAFFPLYPLLIKAVSFVVRDYLIAGLLVTFLSMTAILYLLPRWLREVRVKDSTSVLAGLILSPGAVFLAAVYTEPLFLALALSVFYFTEKKKWGYAVLASALATAARVNGLFLAAYLIFRIVHDRVQLKKYLPLSLLSFSGIGAYMAYLYYRTGDALAWFHTQSEWGKGSATSPFTTAVNYLRAVTVEFTPDLTHLVVVIEVVVTLWALYLTYLVFKKKMLAQAYRLYLAGNLAMPILTGSLGSMPRFFLTLFPLLAVYPALPQKTRFIALSVSSILGIVGIILFTRGYWYA